MTQTEEEGTSEHSPRCTCCGYDTPFDLSDDLVHAAHDGKLIVFAGAGVSTEVPSVFPSTMYSEALASLKAEPAASDFPDVMSEYERQYGRARLIEDAWTRFEYVDSFARLRAAATKFHRELATMPYIRDIITTNWDPYFEQECGAIPIVTGDDYALSNLDRRKVYKIHGSINVVSSIVATREDYDRCLRGLASNALGGTIRHLIATRPVVFVGYSLRDFDFQQMYNALVSDLGRMRPDTYYVGPFESPLAVDMNMTQITTDGAFFLRRIKEEIVKHGCHLPDTVYRRVAEFENKAYGARRPLYAIDHTEHPGVLYCHFYLDGVLDASDRIRSRRVSGEYSNRARVADVCKSYEELLDRAMERGRFDDAAYIEGYLNTVITLLLHDDEPDPPLYFCFNKKSLDDFESAKRSIARLKSRNAAAWAKAKEISDRAGKGIIFMHTPFLAGVLD